jgi:hypothetical protein
LAVANDPVLIAYGATRTQSGRRFWRAIGRAYPHDEGQGLTLVLDACPLDGRVVLLEPDEADERRAIVRARMKGSST